MVAFFLILGMLVLVGSVWLWRSSVPAAPEPEPLADPALLQLTADADAVAAPAEPPAPLPEPVVPTALRMAEAAVEYAEDDVAKALEVLDTAIDRLTEAKVRKALAEQTAPTPCPGPAES